MNSENNEIEKFIVIPKESIKPELLDAIIEDFILREGTDYGHQNVDLAQKKQQVINQINSGHVVVSFETETETCNLIRKEELNRC